MEPLNPGRIKYTQAKYYRVNGESTQNRGVIPDILLPEVINADEIGESSLPQTMAWDQIRAAEYNKVSVLTQVINYLKEKHMSRIKMTRNSDFLMAYLILKKTAKEKVSLNESVRLKER
jgi:carboxyl-terminal processing protease